MGKSVTVYLSDGGSFSLREGESLLAGLARDGRGIAAPCGGLGRCGKCKVKVRKGALPVTGQDEKVFSPAALAEGWRLACRAFPGEDVEIVLPEDPNRDFEILSEACPVKRTAAPEQTRAPLCPETGYSVAVDLGTTTIVMALLGEDGTEALHTVSFVNGQRKYGADVISRIQASVDGKQEKLRECVRIGLEEGLAELAVEAGIPLSGITQVVISGNTTMGHLLLGYPCQGLGVYPFTPVNLELVEGGFLELTRHIAGGEGGAACRPAEPGEKGGAACCPVNPWEEAGKWDPKLVLLPGISTFVGGDIVAGLYAADFDRKEKICLLVDLGTNGEMALGCREKILTASTAAGPAFEGGNITWGMGSVAGAVCSVRLDGEGKVHAATIQNAPPVGICGTGVVETVCELVRAGIVDETGMLREEYFDEGFPLARTPEGRQIVFTQRDIREIQLAKAAVRAGVETLLLRYGISAGDVEEVYLAGGFGHKLDPEAAVSIGMLPGEFLGSIRGVGNSSLAGAMKYLREEDAKERLQAIRRISREIGLAADKDFQAFYMDAMYFERDAG